MSPRESHAPLKPPNDSLLVDAEAKRRSPRERQILRRRVTALAGLAAVLLLVSILVGGGSGHHSTSATARKPGLAVGDAARRRAAAQDRAIDRVLAYSPFVTTGGGAKRMIALTFDDGPGPYTPRVLRTLRKLKVHATFFEVGFMERWVHRSTTQALRDGHVVGDHTESPPRLGLLRRPDQRKQIVEQAEWLGKLGAPKPRLFRPPFGSFDAHTMRVLRRNRMLMVLWSVDSQDYRRPGVKTIVRRVVRGAHPGAIVLMHDAGGARSQTVQALPKIVRQLRQRHYQFVTVPELLSADPPAPGQTLPHYVSGVG